MDRQRRRKQKNDKHQTDYQGQMRSTMVEQVSLVAHGGLCAGRHLLKELLPVESPGWSRCFPEGQWPSGDTMTEQEKSVRGDEWERETAVYWLYTVPSPLLAPLGLVGRE